jgi:hypothetical protein
MAGIPAMNDEPAQVIRRELEKLDTLDSQADNVGLRKALSDSKVRAAKELHTILAKESYYISRPALARFAMSFGEVVLQVLRSLDISADEYDRAEDEICGFLRDLPIPTNTEQEVQQITDNRKR